jgi:hypothetical protein
MHDAPDTTDPVLEEQHRGCLRIRLYRFGTDTGPTFGVEVSAWNGWAGQAKLLAFTGGFTEEAARGVFASVLSEVVDYDWMTGEVVLADGAR